MFDIIFRKKRILAYRKNASMYIERILEPQKNERKAGTIVRYSLSGNIPLGKKNEEKQETQKSDTDTGGVDITVNSNEKYDSKTVAALMKKYSTSETASGVLKKLDSITEKTFTDVLISHIYNRGLKDSEVYKAAQMDRRLFSKIMSDIQYKPAKDTAIALAFALHLSFGEALDLLYRAGYTLSHSSKRDIIIEYFFRKNIYKLVDINCVLYDLGQKPIGR